MNSIFDRRPLLIGIAGPDGAGKTTFFRAQLEQLGLHFVNADMIALELGTDSYSAARVAQSTREELIRQRESFVFETVFSDPAGDKLGFFKEAVVSGYTVLLCFVGISSAEVSEERVSLRVMKGGHDVPLEKIVGRYPRTMANLKRAILELPHVWVFDNDDPADPHRVVVKYEDAKVIESHVPIPFWLEKFLP